MVLMISLKRVVVSFFVFGDLKKEKRKKRDIWKTGRVSRATRTSHMAIVK